MPRGRLALAGAVLLLVAGPLALLVRGEWAPLLSLDRAVTEAAQRAPEAVVPVARLLTVLGDPLLASLVTLLAVLALLPAGLRRLALVLAVSRLGAQLLSSGLKALVDRARPSFEVPVAMAGGASWPSGHALAAGALWGTLALVLLPRVRSGLRPAVVGAALLVVVVVATTRVLLGVHYLTDVVAGSLLGLAWAALVVGLLLPRRPEQVGS